MADDHALHQRVPLHSRLLNGFTIYAVQTLSTPARWVGSWSEWFWPSGYAANITKVYECRPYLPVRIFFPKTYDQTSPENLPLIFVIHGGGFCIGSPEDDDEWNRRFSDEHNFLVVELNYRKAPGYPFPTAIHDVEALMLAVMEDDSLPIDKKRIAVVGFSAGGNLALSVCQLPSIQEKVRPAAALPVYPAVDMTVPPEERARRRQYKSDLGPGLRGQTTDMLAWFSIIFNWSYINPGQDLRDPLLSPYFAERAALPRHVFFVAAELDQLSHGAWRMACKLAGRSIPSSDDRAGQEKPAEVKGGLILNDDRFAFEAQSPSGGSVRWLLIPDQVHGFDHLPERWYGDRAAFTDARVKMELYQKLFAEWLSQVVWQDLASEQH